MINSDVCLNCICVPMCMPKLITKLVAECPLICVIYDNVVDVMKVNQKVTINFSGINKSTTIYKIDDLHHTTDVKSNTEIVLCK